MAKKNYVVKGSVAYAGFNEEDSRNIITLAISKERAEILNKALSFDGDKFTATPIKENEAGELIFKATSKFEVEISEDGKESDIKITDIGKNSDVELYIGIGESRFKGKTYQVAYLKAINILDFVPFEKFNAFADDAEITVI